MLNPLYNKVSNLQADRISQLAPLLIALVFAAMLITAALALYQTSRYQPEIATTDTGKQSPAIINYKATDITNSNLFGITVGGLSGLDKSQIPTTLLQLTLRGAFTSANDKLASAIIEGPDGLAKSFKINSRVYGSTELHAVFNDRVVLSRNGQLETLLFPDPSQSTSANSTAPVTSLEQLPDGVANLVRDNMTPQQIQQAENQLRSSAMTPEQRQQLIKKRLTDLRDRARAKRG